MALNGRVGQPTNFCFERNSGHTAVALRTSRILVIAVAAGLYSGR